MSFDIRQRLQFSGSGIDERAARAYADQLMNLFAGSPEGLAICEADGSVGHAGLLIDYALSYEGVAPPDLTPAIVEEIVFSLFPRKVSAEPTSAAGMVRELRAFLRFLVREFGLNRLESCLDVLGEGAVARLETRMADPRYWGMAKSTFMEGTRRGFDLSTQEGLDRWIAVQNAEAAMGTRIRNPAPRRNLEDELLFATDPDEPMNDLPEESPAQELSAAEKARRKKKRKMEKASQKRNRRR